MAAIISARLDEVNRLLGAKAPLSVIFMYGSILEGVLLGAARKNSDAFKRAPASPKHSSGSVRAFQKRTLAQLINVAEQAGVLGLDVKKLSHGLRDC